MTILFAGGELGSFLPADSTVRETLGDASGGYDPAYARCAINLPQGPVFALGAAFAPTNAIWLHVNATYFPNFIFAGNFQAIEVQASGVPVFQMVFIGSNPNGLFTQLQYWNGAAFVDVGSPFIFNFAATQTFDFQISDSSIFCYISGTLKAGATGAFPNVTAMTAAKFYPNNNTMEFSEVIIADQPTVGYRLQTLVPTGNGGTQQWAGDFTDIDEIITNDGQFISTPNPNEVMLFSQSTVTTQSIRAVVVTARVAATPGSPQNVQLACESGGVTHFSASFLQGLGFAPNVGIFPTDPNTGSPWTNAAVNAMQYGVKSIA
jgi:hypothetical protein